MRRSVIREEGAYLRRGYYRAFKQGKNQYQETISLALTFLFQNSHMDIFVEWQRGILKSAMFSCLAFRM